MCSHYKITHATVGHKVPGEIALQQSSSSRHWPTWLVRKLLCMLASNHQYWLLRKMTSPLMQQAAIARMRSSATFHKKNSDESIPTLKPSSSQVPCKLSFKTSLQGKLEGLAHNCCGQNICKGMRLTSQNQMSVTELITQRSKACFRCRCGAYPHTFLLILVRINNKPSGGCQL